MSSVLAYASPRTRAWLGGMAVAALLAILGAYDVPGRWLHYLAKPAATLCAVALVAGLSSPSRRYRNTVLCGLLLSALGDVLLMLPGDYFAAGLAAFLAAHLAYLAAFTDGVRFAPRLVPFFGYAVVATSLVAMLWPGIPVPLRAPVLLYVAALATMAAQAAARWWCLRTSAALIAAVGAGVFVVSDATIALDRFRVGFAAAPALILASYWMAQALIAISACAQAAPGSEQRSTAGSSQ